MSDGMPLEFIEIMSVTLNESKEEDGKTVYTKDDIKAAGEDEFEDMVIAVSSGKASFTEDALGAMTDADKQVLRKHWFKRVSEGRFPTEGGVSGNLAVGNVLRDNEGTAWRIKRFDVNSLILEPYEGGVGTIKQLSWDEASGLGLVKIGESKVNEGADLYCPNCGENLGKATENFKIASCGTCGETGIKNPAGQPNRTAARDDMEDYVENFVNSMRDNTEVLKKIYKVIFRAEPRPVDVEMDSLPMLILDHVYSSDQRELSRIHHMVSDIKRRTNEGVDSHRQDIARDMFDREYEELDYDEQAAVDASVGLKSFKPTRPFTRKDIFVEKKWDGTTDSGSEYYRLRMRGLSHDEAVAQIERKPKYSNVKEIKIKSKLIEKQVVTIPLVGKNRETGEEYTYPSNTYNVIRSVKSKGHTYHVTDHILDDGQNLVIVDTLVKELIESNLSELRSKQEDYTNRKVRSKLDPKKTGRIKNVIFGTKNIVVDWDDGTKSTEISSDLSLIKEGMVVQARAELIDDKIADLNVLVKKMEKEQKGTAKASRGNELSKLYAKIDALEKEKAEILRADEAKIIAAGDVIKQWLLPNGSIIEETLADHNAGAEKIAKKQGFELVTPSSEHDYDKQLIEFGKNTGYIRLSGYPGGEEIDVDVLDTMTSSQLNTIKKLAKENNSFFFIFRKPNPSISGNSFREFMEVVREQDIESKIEEGLVDHAKAELTRAGLFKKDSDYNGMLGEAVMELMELFANQGHSGFSAGMVTELFNLLSTYQPLTELTNDPNEWMLVSEDQSHSEKPLYQSRRKPSCFSEDNGLTYYDIDEDWNKTTDPDGTVWSGGKTKEEWDNKPMHTSVHFET
jgi:hypothetical protein